ncbi:MAG: Hint domain-containing protein [Rhodobacteraceae bacterium]|nr:Hint domain-containing protein [Marivita sp. XM-24bin2]MCR9108820.1 Hint domain-containing protein [Paracoccaceae bacterium]PWL34033.1 MAG: hypothetical protein DCO97_16390 [Marivita sp. XM-24bin2]
MADSIAGDDTAYGVTSDDRVWSGWGNDSIFGSDGNDTFVYVAGDGSDTISDFNTDNTGTQTDGDAANNDFIDLSAFYDIIWELTAGQRDDRILNKSKDGVNGVDYSDNASFGRGSMVFSDAVASISYFNVEKTGVVCFAAETRLQTAKGFESVDTLVPGHLVMTEDHGLLSVRFTRSTEHEWSKEPHSDKPILISKAALDGTVPDRDVRVSPQHRDLIHDMITGDERLVPAKALTGLPGARTCVIAGRSATFTFRLIGTPFSMRTASLPRVSSPGPSPGEICPTSNARSSGPTCSRQPPGRRKAAIVSRAR